MYTSLAAILVFVVFGWLLLDKTQVVDFGIFSVKQNNNPNGVFADYVAEIVGFIIFSEFFYFFKYSFVKSEHNILLINKIIYFYFYEVLLPTLIIFNRPIKAQ